MEKWEEEYRKSLEDDKVLRADWDDFASIPQGRLKMSIHTGRGGAIEMLVGFRKGMREMGKGLVELMDEKEKAGELTPYEPMDPEGFERLRKKVEQALYNTKQ